MGSRTAPKAEKAFEVGHEPQLPEVQRVSQNARHRLWLKRSSASDPGSWRPKKRYRVATAKWLCSLDNQV